MFRAKEETALVAVVDLTIRVPEDPDKSVMLVSAMTQLGRHFMLLDPDMDRRWVASVVNSAMGVPQ